MPNKHTIIYFDHSNDVKNRVVQKFKGIDIYIIEVSTAIDQIAAVTELKDNTNIVIAHMHDDECWESLVASSPPNSVRLRVSTQGLKGNQNFQTPDKKVNCLFLNLPHYNLTADQWRLVLEAITTIETVKAIMNANVPSSLYPYFGEPTKGESMALSILCLGYLAAWASSQDYDEAALNQITAEDNKDEIKNLLREFQKLPDHQTMMKTRFISSSGGVQGSSYWKVFGPNASEVLAAEAENCGMKSDAVFTTVLKLAKKIDYDEIISDPVLVANAYLEIKAHEKSLAS